MQIILKQEEIIGQRPAACSIDLWKLFDEIDAKVFDIPEPPSKRESAVHFIGNTTQQSTNSRTWLQLLARRNNIIIGPR